MNYKEYIKYLLSEATLQQTKDVFKKSEYSREKTDNLYKDLFNQNEYQNDSRKYRIYIPFKFDMSRWKEEAKNPLMWKEDKTGIDFDQFLRGLFVTTGYNTNTLRDVYTTFKLYFYDFDKTTYLDKIDYKNGYFFDEQDRPIKIAKLFLKLHKEQPQLELDKLIKNFNEDRLRDGNTKIDYDHLMICITKNPIDVLNQSTDRKWTSCMNLHNKGEQKCYVPEDIKEGTILAYLIESKDIKIQDPLARLAIKPYKGSLKEETFLKVSNNCYDVLYGSFVESMREEFQKQTEDYIEKYHNSKLKQQENIYNLSSNLYRDEGEYEINKGNIDTEKLMYDSITKFSNEADLVFDTGLGAWIFQVGKKQGIVKTNGDIILKPYYYDIEQLDGMEHIYKLKQLGYYKIFNMKTKELFSVSPLVTYMTNYYDHSDFEDMKEYYKNNPNAETYLSDVEFKDGKNGYVDLKGRTVYKY